MAFSTQITIPANTTVDDPAMVELTTANMRVIGLDIDFPTGCVGLVECWIEYQGRQIFPYNPEGTFVANGRSIHTAPQFDLLGPPFGIRIYGINADDTFDHTLYIVVDAIFLDKYGKVDTNVVAALQEIFAMPGR